MKSKLIKVQPQDNVAVALVDLYTGDAVDFEGESIKILSEGKTQDRSG